MADMSRHERFNDAKSDMATCYDRLWSLHRKIDQTLSMLSENDEDDADILDREKVLWSKMIAELEKNYKRFQRENMVVVCFGGVSSGKSTVTNALLDRKLCPMDVTPVTDMFTEIRTTPEEKNNEYFVFRGKRFDDLSKLKNFVHSLKNRHLDPRPTSSEKVEVYIKIQKNIFFQKHTVIVDAPGENVSEAGDTGIKEVCSDADIFLYIVNATQGFRETEKKFLRSVKQTFGTPNIFLLFNCWDLVLNSDDVGIMQQRYEKEAEVFLKDEIRVSQKSENRVYFVSAKDKLMRADTIGKHNFEQFSENLRKTLAATAIDDKLGPLCKKMLQSTYEIADLADRFMYTLKLKGKILAEKSKINKSYQQKLKIFENRASSIKDCLNPIDEERKVAFLKIATALNEYDPCKDLAKSLENFAGTVKMDDTATVREYVRNVTRAFVLQLIGLLLEPELVNYLSELFSWSNKVGKLKNEIEVMLLDDATEPNILNDLHSKGFANNDTLSDGCPAKSLRNLIDPTHLTNHFSNQIFKLLSEKDGIQVRVEGGVRLTNDSASSVGLMDAISYLSDTTYQSIEWVASYIRGVAGAAASAVGATVTYLASGLGYRTAWTKLNTRITDQLCSLETRNFICESVSKDINNHSQSVYTSAMEPLRKSLDEKQRVAEVSMNELLAARELLESSQSHWNDIKREIENSKNEIDILRKKHSFQKECENYP